MIIIRFRKTRLYLKTIMQVSDNLNDNEKLKTTPLLSLHLDSPVRDAKIRKIQLFIQGKSPLDRSSKHLYHEFKGLMEEGHTSWENLSFGFYPFFYHLSKITDKNPNNIDCSSLTNLHSILNLTSDLVNCQIRMLPHHLKACTVSPNIDRGKLTSSEVLQYYWKLKVYFEELVMISATGSQRAQHLIEKTPIHIKETNPAVYTSYLTKHIKICLGRELILIQDKEHKYNWFGTREHLLMLADVSCQRFMVILASELAALNNMNHYLTPGLLQEVFNWGDKLLAFKGNEGYELIGMWESLIIGSLLKVSEDPYIDNDSFYNTMVSNFKEKGGTSEQIHELNHIFQKSIDITISNGFQLFGLYRIWGHPTIDSAKGILKLRKLAGRPRPVNTQKINIIYEKFCEYFCMAYYKKNSSWPNCDTSKLPSHSYIGEKISKNLPIDSNHPDYNSLDWHLLKFEKTFIIPKQFDLSELISDKAMSNSFSKLKESIEKHGHIGNSADRSVIIQWIQSELGDPEEFLRDIDQNGFGPDETVVGTCPKEREIKIWARLFGLLTFKKRMYVVLTEALIATYFLKYFPEITVMNNQTELLKKQLFATTGMSKNSNSSFVKIVVNIDFNKWNTNMREIETKGVFKVMDNLLGFNNLIQRTHEMFSQSTMYLADGTICPEILRNRLKPSPYVWRGHLGGIEGLRQKGWTLWTVVILKYIIEQCNIKAQLMGQGDNQVLICYYPKHLGERDIISMHKNFLTTLEDFISDLGPPLKREETWESTVTYLYGKFPIFKGCPQPMSLKKISRLMKCSNEGFPTMDSSLSSLSAGFFDSSWMDYSPLIPCICYTFEVINSLGLHIQRSLLSYNSIQDMARSKILFKIPDGTGGQREVLLPPNSWLFLDNDYKLLWCLFFTPRCLGGYPITWLIDVLIRGFPDPLTLNISGLKNLLKSQAHEPLLHWQKQCIQNILHPWFNPTKSYDMLGEDPLSLNLLHPSSPSDQLKRLVFDLLMSPGIQKSEKFENFLEKVKPNQTELATYLSQMTPKLNPRIMHEILASTVTSRAMQVIQRINKTNTLTYLMIKNHDRDLTKRIVTSELNYFVSVIFQITTFYPFPEIDCSTKLSNYLRNSSWGLDITGITVASPLEAFDIYDANDTACNPSHSRISDGYILLKNFNETRESIDTNLGPSIPYIGSMTIQKVKGYGQTVSKTAAPVLTRIAKLLALIGWGTDRNSNMSNALRELLKSITDINPDLFEAKFGEVSGSVEHRFHDQAVSRGCFLPILYNESSWLSLSTSTLTKYSKGSKNVNLSFQSIMILLEGWFSLNKMKHVFAGYHFHLTCEDCIQPIFEEMLDLPTLENPALLFPSYPDDPYFWVSKDQIDVVDELTYSLQGEFPASLDNSRAFDIFHELIARFVVENFRRFVEEQGTSGVSVQMGNQIAIAWIYKMNPHLFLTNVIRLLYDYYIYHNIFNITSLDTELNGFILFLIRIPPQWFSILYPLTMEHNIIIGLVTNGYLTPPAGVPPSLHQWCISFRSMLINIIMKDKLSLVFFSYTNFSHFPEFYPCWNHLVTFCLTKSISFLKLREAKKWLPLDLISQSKGGVSTRSLFYQNSRNSDHPRYWKSWGELYNLISLKSWYTTYSTPDYWAKLVNDSPALSSKVSKFSPIEKLPPLNDVLLRLSHDKESQGIHEVVIKINKVPKSKLDPGYIGFFKPFGRSTTSIYKAFSIFNSVLNGGNFFFSKILVVGDGAGGFSLAAKMISPQSEVMYNSKITPECVGPQGLPGYYPSDFYYYPEIANEIKGIGLTIMGVSDICNPMWVNQMSSYNPDLLISDAEFPFNSPLILSKAITNLLTLCLKQGVEVFIFKFYYQESIAMALICEVIHHYYKVVTVKRSFYSNENGSEVYIFGEGIRDRSLLYHLEIVGDSWKFKGATSEKLVKQLIDQFEEITSPNKILINEDFNTISKYLERPMDLNETLSLRSKLGVVSTGLYPAVIFSSWISQIHLGSYEEWKAKKKFIVNDLKSEFLKTLMVQHLYYLGLLVKSQTTFGEWLSIYHSGFLYIWLSRDEKWRSGISLKRKASGGGYCRFRLFKYVYKHQILNLIKIISREQYFKISHVKTTTSLTFPLPLPPLTGRYSRKHDNRFRIKIDELPASKGLSLSLFGFKHEKVSESYISSSMKIHKPLIIID
nr:MAG: RNA-dependent RNA polymerase [Rhabdoviridae-like virus 2]